MRPRILFLVIASIVFVPLLHAQTATLTYVAGLTGDGVPVLAGDALCCGNATMTISGTQVTLDVATIFLRNANGVSLLQGSALTPQGALVVTFTDTSNVFVNGRFHGSVSLDPATISAIEANPQNYYLSVSAGSPSSEAIRGQLTDANTVTFAGSISGSSPTCNNGAGGIAGASGSFVFDLRPDPGGATYTIRYDIVTSGLGNTISALQIGDELGGPGLINFGIDKVGLNGRFAGTGQITNVQKGHEGTARLLLTLPSSVRFTVTTPASGVTCAASGPIRLGHEIFIPVAGSVHGVANTNYQTDVNIFNNSVQGTTGTTDAVMQFFPTGAGAAQAQSAAWTTLAPRGMAVFRDASTTGFAGQVNGIGAIRIVSAGNIFANARVYNNLTASGGGTFGQYVAGMPRTQALSEGTLLGLTNTSSASGARTNIGFFNPSDNAATMAFEMRGGDGAVIATRLLMLAPWQQTQMPLIGGLFSGITGDVTTASVYFLSSYPLYVYASVVDNVTGDGNFVTPSTSSNGGTSSGF